MTNEELAVLAAQGDRESQHKLYFAVAPLIYKITSRYFKHCEGNRRGVRPEDLIQCGYFAFLGALKQYSPERELKFTSYLDLCVAGECWRALGIVFPTGRGAVNKEVETISFETPTAGEDEELTLESTIADPNAEADITECVEYNEMQLIVRREVDRLNVKEQIVIHGLFWDEKALEQIAEEQGWGGAIIHRTKNDAYHKLYNSEVMQFLAAAYDWGEFRKKERSRYRQKSREKGIDSIVTWGRSGIDYLDKETVDTLFKDGELTPIGGLMLWD